MSDYSDLKKHAESLAAGPYDYGTGQQILALLKDFEIATNVGRAMGETLGSVVESRDALVRVVEQLKAENEALRKYAVRYQLLRSNTTRGGPVDFCIVRKNWGSPALERILTLEDADNELDAAMAKDVRP